MKWAIVEDEPVGVTMHFIGDYVDAGNIIERVSLPVFISDTFHAVARRVYETEVKMLVDAAIRAENGSLNCIISTDGEGYEVHRRMPRNIERDLILRFEEYKGKHGIHEGETK